MITASQIESATGLTNVIMYGDGAIDSTPAPTAEQRAQVQAWHEAGAVNAIPVSVTPLQMRRALRATGLKATVDAALAAQSEEVREEWEFASEVRRDNATLNALGQSLGKSPADLDALFQIAATL
jgi:hypothetical protein